MMTLRCTRMLLVAVVLLFGVCVSETSAWGRYGWGRWGGGYGYGGYG